MHEEKVKLRHIEHSEREAAIKLEAATLADALATRSNMCRCLR